MLVTRVPALGDDSFPSFTAGALPGFFIGKPRHSLERFLEGQILQQAMALVQRQQRYIAAIQP